MLRATLRFFCCCLTLTMATGLSGCRWASSTAAHEPSLLKPLDMVDDGVQLEIISIRFSPHDEELNGMLWDQIDEQQIPLATRRALGENGFRAGVISGELPAPLARKLAAAEKKPATMTEAAARLEKASPVSRQQMQLHSGWRGEIIASNIYPEVPLLMNEHGEVSGHTYQQAQGILAAKAEALGDRRVTLHLTPELQYGEPRQEWISEDGRILPQSGKPKRVFERLAFDATLEPSQMLVLTASPERPGTLGHYFFTEPQPDSDEVQQKLVVVRLGQTRYDNLFPPAAENESKSVDAPSDKNDPAQRPKQSSQRSASEP